MRRWFGLFLLGLAGFLLVMSALVKFYAYPTLAVAPLDQQSVSRVVGGNVTYFDRGALKQAQDTLTTTVRVIGDVSAAKKQGDGVAVWDKSSVTENSKGEAIAVSTERIAFDQFSGEAVQCCGTKTDDKATNFKGLTFKWPFNTQKKTYPFWDGDLGRTVSMKYVGTTKIKGLTTYHFHQEYPPTKISSVTLPGFLLGAGSGNVTADEYISANRDYYVEPETGATVRVVERPDDALRLDGQEKLVLTRGTVQFPDADVAKNVKDYKSKGGQLHLLRVVLPILGLILGLLALVVGALLLALGRDRTGEEAYVEESNEGEGVSQTAV